MALKSEKLFDAMIPLLKGKAGEDLVKKVKAVYHFELTKAKGETPVVYTIDFKNGSGCFSFLMLFLFIFIEISLFSVDFFLLFLFSN